MTESMDTHSSPHPVSPQAPIKLLMVFLVSATLIGGALYSSHTPTPQPSTPPLAPTPFTPPNDQQLIYGTWENGGSTIASYQFSSQTTQPVARLPLSIKKVTPLDDNSFLFINGTDQFDYGSQLALYTVPKKQTTTILTADSGFRIDTYVLSQNKRYVAVWEIESNPLAPILSGGKSRIYTLDRQNPTIKHRIYEEAAAGQPIHYPIAISSDGTVFTDTFLPNSNAGWAYGMATSSIDGSVKQDIATMKNGTYSTQPLMSPDEKYLIFVGYASPQNDGTSLVNGTRKAFLSPNSVVLLDTHTLQRTSLDLPPTDQYLLVSWADPTTLILSILTNTPSQSGFFLYSLSTKKLTAIEGIQTGAINAVVAQLPDAQLIVGKKTNASTLLGNLGDSYGYVYDKLFVLDKRTHTISPLPLSGSIQYIGLSQELSGTQTTDTSRTLQIGQFDLKPKLAPKRLLSQNNPPLTPIPTQSPLAQPTISTVRPSTNPLDLPVDQLPQPQPGMCNNQGTTLCTYKYGQNTPDQIACNQWINRVTGVTNPSCYASPLYLYGPAGQHVTITIDTPITNAIPAYTSSYNAVLQQDSTILVGGKPYPSITFDYQPAVRPAKPQTGTITSQQNLEQTVKRYAQRLGLNEKETEDLVDYTQTHLVSPYVFVSFYDDQTSQQILPIRFDPQPNTYRNIIFYFKKLSYRPSYTPQEPSFPLVESRGLFTAVEISEIVE